MKAKQGAVLAAVVVLVVGMSETLRAQTPPANGLLNSWSFNDVTNWTGDFGDAPISFTNLAVSTLGDGDAVVVDGTNTAWLKYPIVENNGTTNLTLLEGSILFWFAPIWAGTNENGTGPRGWARLIEAGSEEGQGYWSIYTDPGGVNLYFSAGDGNGSTTNYLCAPLDWTSNRWHQVALTYSSSNTLLYLDGTLATNGPGISVVPGLNAMTNSFCVGSSQRGETNTQAHGMFDDIATYDSPLDADTIGSNFNFYSGSYYANPLNAGNLFSSDGKGSGGGGSYSPHNHFDGNSFWLELTGFSNSLAHLTVHSPITNGIFEIWATTNLASSNWTWVAMSAPMQTNFVVPSTPSACYFRATTPVFNGPGGQIIPYIGLPYGALWLEIFGVSNATVSLKIHGTISGEMYEVLSKQRLTDATWSSEGTAFGSDGQDWTPMTVSVRDRTNALFMEARYPGSSAGNLIPDWWLLKYFGTTSVDPYAQDSSGDGWTILDDYQNGFVPGVWHTPATPRLTVRYNSGSGAVTVSWPPSGGAVIGYTLQKSDWEAAQDTNFTFSAATQTFAENISSQPVYPYYYGHTKPVYYQLQAHYTGGDSAWSVGVPIEPASLAAHSDYLYSMPADFIHLVADAGGKVSLVASLLPPGTETLRLDRIDYFANSYGNSSFDTHIEIPVSDLADGVTELPNDFMDTPVDGYGKNYYQWYVQAKDGNNGLSADARLQYYEDRWLLHRPDFVIASRHIKENLKFLLRSATITQPFRYFSNINADGSTNQSALWGFMENPQAGYGRSMSSTDYEYYGFDIFGPDYWWDGLRPIRENFLWHNFAYDPLNFHNGYLTNAISYDVNFDYPMAIRYLFSPTSRYAGGGTESPLPLALSTTNSTWIYREPTEWIWNGYGGVWPPEDEVNAYTDVNDYVVVRNFRNCYGLNLISMRVGTDSPVAPGSELPDGPLFLNFEAPVLTNAGYFFTSGPSEPGSPDFTVTNVSPLLVAGFGQSLTVSAWEKEGIANGYSGKYAYEEQYLDKVYIIDTNGIITTNQAGFLNPYGEFFPTNVGPAALVTLPDIENSARGTGVVNVIKLQLDVNHDGEMDLSYNGPDNTSQERPFVFWVNNNFDRSALDAEDQVYYDDDVSSMSREAQSLYNGKFTPDYDYTDSAGTRSIPCTRDLQDFARLWICGITTNVIAALPPDSTVTLSWGDVGNPNSGNPTIDLFRAADADGGIGYLTNSTTAIVQTLLSSYPRIGRLGPGQSIQLNAATFSNNWAGNYFIWCGASNGTGALTLTISQGGTNTLAETEMYVQLVDIKQMYERWTIGDVPSFPPKTNAVPAIEGVPQKFEYPYNPATDANTPYILLVHGWNMEAWEKDRFAESAFKRLYWQGYQGRFGSFRWPTYFGFKGGGQALTDTFNYNNSESNAWHSATGLLNLLTSLNAKYPDHVFMLAHSMGNIVAGEALRLAGTNQVVNTYVASQGSVPAHTYDSSITNLLQFQYQYPSGPLYYLGTINYGPYTPNIYGNWLAGNSGGVGRRVNFYNANDFALAMRIWGFNQVIKPDVFPIGRYSYTGSPNDTAPWHYFVFTVLNATNYFDVVNSLNDRYEVMPYAAQARSTALGATPGVSGFFKNVNLATIWPADQSGHNFADHFWHSGEFRGDYPQLQSYWRELLGSDAFNLK